MEVDVITPGDWARKKKKEAKKLLETPADEDKQVNYTTKYLDC